MRRSMWRMAAQRRRFCTATSGLGERREALKLMSDVQELRALMDEGRMDEAMELCGAMLVREAHLDEASAESPARQAIRGTLLTYRAALLDAEGDVRQALNDAEVAEELLSQLPAPEAQSARDTVEQARLVRAGLLLRLQRLHEAADYIRESEALGGDADDWAMLSSEVQRLLAADAQYALQNPSGGPTARRAAQLQRSLPEDWRDAIQISPWQSPTAPNSPLDRSRRFPYQIVSTRAVEEGAVVYAEVPEVVLPVLQVRGLKVCPGCLRPMNEPRLFSYDMDAAQTHFDKLLSAEQRAELWKGTGLAALRPKNAVPCGVARPPQLPGQVAAKECSALYCSAECRDATAFRGHARDAGAVHLPGRERVVQFMHDELQRAEQEGLAQAGLLEESRRAGEVASVEFLHHLPMALQVLAARSAERLRGNAHGECSIDWYPILRMSEECDGNAYEELPVEKRLREICRSVYPELKRELEDPMVWQNLFSMLRLSTVPLRIYGAGLRVAAADAEPTPFDCLAGADLRDVSVKSPEAPGGVLRLIPSPDPATEVLVDVLLPVTSRLPHSCVPNVAVREVLRSAQSVEVVALRPLLPGEDLTFSLLDRDLLDSLPPLRRHQLLQDVHRVHCQCPRCISELGSLPNL